MNIFKNNELKNFYLFTVGQFISQFGSKMTSYGLVLWIYKESGSVISASFLTASYLIPEILFSFMAGSISDRWNKKKIILSADTTAVFFSAIVLIMLTLGILKTEYLYFINFILGIADSFQNPASEVAVSIIVSKENYIKTSGIRSFFNSFLDIFVPVTAVFIYSFFGLKFIIMADIGTFTFAFITLKYFVEIPEIPFKKEKEDLRERCICGLKYIFKRKEILNLIMFMGFINLIAGIYNTGMAPMILSRGKNGDAELGIVTGTIGVAGLLGSLLVAKFPKASNVKKKISFMTNIMMFSFLVCDMFLGFGRNFIVWTAGVFLGNIFIPFLLTNYEYIIRTEIPIEMQGRVFSAQNTVQYFFLPVGNLLCGFMADKIFEPFMENKGAVQNILKIFIGEGKGGGLALMYIFIGITGAVGCIYFKTNKNLKKFNR